MNERPHTRLVEDCPHRCSDSQQNEDTETCKLLQAISGVRDESILHVERSACEACCDSFEPTPEDWNPVVASLLHGVATEVIEKGGADGCSIEQATELANASIQNLPVVLPDEDDGVDDLQTFVAPQNVTLASIKKVLPLPDVLRASSEISWAVGVTTAPRRQPTLSTCLRSLIASGWDAPQIFVDGDVQIDDAFNHLPQVRRASSIGAWPAWCETLRTLLADNPVANTLAIVQDDALFPEIPVLREYVETLLWPNDESGDSAGIVSMYTSTDDMQNENVWRVYPEVWKYGAVAFIFRRETAERILKSADGGELNFVSGTAGIDSRVGVWADRNKVGIWHSSPSLVQHIGQVSAVWKRSRAVGLRRADRFIADEFR